MTVSSLRFLFIYLLFCCTSQRRGPEAAFFTEFKWNLRSKTPPSGTTAVRAPGRNHARPPRIGGALMTSHSPPRCLMVAVVLTPPPRGGTARCVTGSGRGRRERRAGGRDRTGGRRRSGQRAPLLVALHWSRSEPPGR